MGLGVSAMDFCEAAIPFRPLNVLDPKDSQAKTVTPITLNAWRSHVFLWFCVNQQGTSGKLCPYRLQSMVRRERSQHEDGGDIGGDEKRKTRTTPIRKRKQAMEEIITPPPFVCMCRSCYGVTCSYTATAVLMLNSSSNRSLLFHLLPFAPVSVLCFEAGTPYLQSRVQSCKPIFILPLVHWSRCSAMTKTIRFWLI